MKNKFTPPHFLLYILLIITAFYPVFGMWLLLTVTGIYMTRYEMSVFWLDLVMRIEKWLAEAEDEANTKKRKDKNGKS